MRFLQGFTIDEHKPTVDIKTCMDLEAFSIVISAAAGCRADLADLVVASCGAAPVPTFEHPSTLPDPWATTPPVSLGTATLSLLAAALLSRALASAPVGCTHTRPIR